MSPFRISKETAPPSYDGTLVARDRDQDPWSENSLVPITSLCMSRDRGNYVG